MKRAVVLAWLAMMFPAGGWAENGQVTVREAVTRALEHNHLLKAAEYERQAAAKDVAISRSRYFPRIYLNETLAASNSPTSVFMMKLNQGRFTQNDFQINNLNSPSTYNDFQTALTLEQPLLDFSIGGGLDIARKEEDARGFALERRRQEVTFQVYQTYLEVQKARAYLKTADQAVLGAREHQRLASVRNEAGVGLRSDELRARTYLSEMEQQEITAGNNLQLAKLRLGQAMGSDTGQSYDIAEDAQPWQPPVDTTRLITLALENRQDVKEIEAGVEKAAIGVGLARKSYLPTVYGSATYQQNDRDIPFGRDNDSWIVAGNLRWELFDGLRRNGEVGKARLQQQAAAEYLESYRSEVVMQVKEASMRREEAGKRLEVARHGLLDAEEVVRLVGRRFENSLSTMTELLDAQTALNQARTQLVENESNYALSTARLYQAAGIFLKEVVK
ncbi:MAG: TolC family protein [Geobacter sp.]|nr:MAG: TolC family protein [Geobacter sp.]